MMGAGSGPRPRLARSIALAADLLLVAFLVCIALATAAQVHHNQVAALHGRGPRDRPVGVPGPTR